MIQAGKSTINDNPLGQQMDAQSERVLPRYFPGASAEALWYFANPERVGSYREPSAFTTSTTVENTIENFKIWAEREGFDITLVDELARRKRQHELLMLDLRHDLVHRFPEGDRWKSCVGVGTGGVQARVCADRARRKRVRKIKARVVRVAVQAFGDVSAVADACAGALDAFEARGDIVQTTVAGHVPRLTWDTWRLIYEEDLWRAVGCLVGLTAAAVGTNFDVYAFACCLLLMRGVFLSFPCAAAVETFAVVTVLVASRLWANIGGVGRVAPEADFWLLVLRSIPVCVFAGYVAARTNAFNWRLRHMPDAFIGTTAFAGVSLMCLPRQAGVYALRGVFLPIVEEWVKESSGGALLVGVSELVTSSGHLWILKLALHALSVVLPWRYRVCAHVLWNIAVLTTIIEPARRATLCMSGLVPWNAEEEADWDVSTMGIDELADYIDSTERERDFAAQSLRRRVRGAAAKQAAADDSSDEESERVLKRAARKERKTMEAGLRAAARSRVVALRVTLRAHGMTDAAIAEFLPYNMLVAERPRNHLSVNQLRDVMNQQISVPHASWYAHDAPAPTDDGFRIEEGRVGVVPLFRGAPILTDADFEYNVVPYVRDLNARRILRWAFVELFTPNWCAWTAVWRELLPRRYRVYNIHEKVTLLKRPLHGLAAARESAAVFANTTPMSADPSIPKARSVEQFDVTGIFSSLFGGGVESATSFLVRLRDAAASLAKDVRDLLMKLAREFYEAGARHYRRVDANAGNWWEHFWITLKSSSLDWNGIWEFPPLARLWTLISCFSIAGVAAACKWGFAADDVWSWGMAMTKMIRPDVGSETFLSLAASAVIDCVSTIIAWVREGEWAKVFRCPTATSWLADTEFLLNSPILRYDPGDVSKQKRLRAALLRGEIPSCFTRVLTDDERSEWMRTFLDQGATVKRSLIGTTSAPTRASVDTRMSQLRSALHELESKKQAGRPRVQGLGFVFVGPGGTGKSTLANQILAAIGRRLKLPDSPHHILNYTANANFQDTAQPGQWAVMMDDPELAVMRPNCDVFYADQWVKMLNTAPFMIESAAVETKGKIFASFVTGAIVTNTPPTLHKQLQDPFPFWRRICAYVMVKVKPCFANEAGQLDHSKLDGSRDYLECHVRTYDASQYNASQPFTSIPFSSEITVMSSAQCMQYIVESVAQHYERGRIQMEQAVVDEDSTIEYCSVCYGAMGAHARATPCEGGEVLGSEPDKVTARVTLPQGLRKLPVGDPAQWVTAPPPRKREVAQMDPVSLAVLLLIVAFCYRMSLLVVARVGNAVDTAVSRVEAKLTSAVSATEQKVANVLTGGSGVPLTEYVTSCLEKLEMILVGYIAFRAVYSIMNVIRAHPYVAVAGATAAAVAAPRMGERRVHAGPQDVQQLFTFREVSDSNEGRWDRVAHSHFQPTPQMATQSVDSVLTACAHHIGVVATGIGKVRFWRVRGQYCVTAAHVFGPANSWLQGGEVRLMLGTTVLHFIPVLGENIVRIGATDLCVMRVDNMPISDRDFTTLLSPESQYAKVGFSDESAIPSSPPRRGGVAKMQVRGGVPCWQYDLDTQAGECGLPVVMRSAKATFIGAVHTGRVALGGAYTSECYGDELTLASFDAAVSKLGRPPHEFQCAFEERMFYKDGRDVHLGPIPAKSSFSAAMALRERMGGDFRSAFFPMGSLIDKLPLGNYKTEVRDSLLRPFLRKEEEEQYPDPTKRVHAPRYDGRVIDAGDVKLWSDPWVDNLIGFNTASACRPDLLTMAVEDYLHDAPQPKGEYAAYTLYEAVRGVPGKFDGLNARTSSGMPLGGKKSRWFQVDDETKSVLLHPLIVDQLQSITHHVIEGRFPLNLFVHVPKDEPTTKDFPRIFNVGPLALLLFMRMYLWPVFQYLRENRRFSECSIGLNLLGMHDVDEFVRMYIDLEPEVPIEDAENCGDGDYKWYDISLPGCLSWGQRAIIQGLLDHIRAPRLLQQLAIGALCMAQVTLRFIKNDIVLVVGTTVSGCLVTGELNSLDNSLIARMAYYWQLVLFVEPTFSWNSGQRITRAWLVLKLVHAGKTFYWFREVVVFQSTGDDHLFRSITLYFSMYAMYEICRLMRIVYTHADKSSFSENPNGYSKFKDTTYLKRSFRYDAEAKCWKACLEKKSIVKMLLMEKRSTLSRADHCAELAVNAVREAFYHGREYFRDLSVAVTHAMKSARIDDNLRFNLRSYDAYQGMFERNELKTWGADMDLAAFVEELDPSGDGQWAEYLARSGASGIPEGQTRALVEQMETTTQHSQDHVSESIGFSDFQTGAGAQQGLQAAGVDGLSIVEATSPPMSFSLGLDPQPLLERRVELTPIAISSTAPALWVGVQRSIVREWFLHPEISPIMDQYQGLRGEFEVTVQLLAAGLSYGLYGFSMQSDGIDAVAMQGLHSVKEANATSTVTVEPRNLPQTSCAMINPAESKIITYTLPYNCPLAYYYSGAGAVDPWKLCMVTYQPIGNGNDSTTVVTSEVQIFIRLKPGYQLAALYQQMLPSKGLKLASDAASAMGYSRDTTAGLAPVMVRSGCSFLSNVDQPEQSERVGLYITGRLAPSLGDCGGADHDTFRSLFARPVMQASFLLSPGLATKTVVLTLPVTPFLSHDPIGAPPLDTYTPTVAGFVGMPFQYWRGTMHYRIIVPGPSTLRTKLQVFYNAGSVGPAINAASTTRLANEQFVVSGPTCLDFSVGFAQPTWGVRSYLTSPNQADYAASIVAGTFTNGNVRVALASPVETPGGVTINCIVLAWAGDDMQFWSPRPYAQAKASGATASYVDIGNSFVLQSAHDADLCLTETTELVKSLGFVDVGRDLGGDVVRSVRALMQKPVHFGTLPTGGALYQALLDFIPIPPWANRTGAYLNGGNPTICWAGYYASMFVGVRGSTLLKMQIQTADDTTTTSNGALNVVRCSMPLSLSGAIAPGVVRYWDWTLGNSLKPTIDGNLYEYVIPFQMGLASYWPPRFFQVASGGGTGTDRVIEAILVNGENAVGSNDSLVYLRSYAPDVSLGAFRRTPQIYKLG